MAEDVFPVIAMKGEKIVEVFFAEWEEVGSDEWVLKGSLDIVTPEDADRVIFETAVGCFQLNMTMLAENKVTLSYKAGSGSTLQRCDRTQAFRARNSLHEPVQ